MKTTLLSQEAEDSMRWMFICEDADLLSVLREIIKHFTDMKAEFFTSLEAAYGEFEAQPEAFEFVITDCEMPETVGFEFSCRQRPFEPVSKVLLAAGIELLSDEEAATKGFCPVSQRSLPYPALQRALAPATLKYKEKFSGLPNGLCLVHAN